MQYRNPTNYALLNMADYTKLSNLKKLLRAYWALEKMAANGDTVAHTVFIDLQAAIYEADVLTERQREVIDAVYIYGMTQEEAASDINISRMTLHRDLQGAVKRIQKVLLSGDLYKKGGKAMKKKDPALEWLKKNDPLFNDKEKKDKMEYPYLSDRQLRRRKEKEILSGDLVDPLEQELFEHGKGFGENDE